MVIEDKQTALNDLARHQSIKCKDCLSYHPLSKKTGWCGLWGTAAREDQSCMAGKEKPSAKDGEPDHDDAGEERI